MQAGYGIQLYSLRDITEKNMRGALACVDEAGYSFVEFAGFFGIPAAEIKEMLAQYGLAASGTHTMLSQLEGEELAKTIRYHQKIGCKNIIIPGHDLRDRQKIDDFIRRVSVALPALEKEGLTLGYHNHHIEFLANEDGSRIYELIVEKTALKLELDTFWAFVGGRDPVALMEQLKDRLHFVHLKDGMTDGHGYPLGRGEAPVRLVWDKAKALGVPMVVESETLTPDGMTEARECMKYLKSLS